MLKDTNLELEFPMKTLAEFSRGCSGSDLKELCRNAAMVPVREYMRDVAENEELLQKGQSEVRTILGCLSQNHDLNCSKGFNLRPLTLADFLAHDGTSPLPPNHQNGDGPVLFPPNVFAYYGSGPFPPNDPASEETQLD